MAIKRIYVPATRRDEFMQSFCKAAESIVVGDGRSLPSTWALFIREKLN